MKRIECYEVNYDDVPEFIDLLKREGFKPHDHNRKNFDKQRFFAGFQEIYDKEGGSIFEAGECHRGDAVLYVIPCSNSGKRLKLVMEKYMKQKSP